MNAQDVVLTVVVVALVGWFLARNGKPLSGPAVETFAVNRLRQGK